MEKATITARGGISVVGIVFLIWVMGCRETGQSEDNSDDTSSATDAATDVDDDIDTDTSVGADTDSDIDVDANTDTGTDAGTNYKCEHIHEEAFCNLVEDRDWAAVEGALEDYLDEVHLHPSCLIEVEDYCCTYPEISSSMAWMDEMSCVEADGKPNAIVETYPGKCCFFITFLANEERLCVHLDIIINETLNVEGFELQQDSLICEEEDQQNSLEMWRRDTWD